MKPFDNLSLKETKALFKFPADTSILSAFTDGKLNENEKKAAIRITDFVMPLKALGLIEIRKNGDSSKT